MCANSMSSKMIIGGVEFFTKCPEKCPGQTIMPGQGGLCHRCPIFNCAGEFPLLGPGEFRPDWAEAWKTWFEEGMRGYPILPLRSMGAEDDV